MGKYENLWVELSRFLQTSGLRGGLLTQPLNHSITLPHSLC